MKKSQFILLTLGLMAGILLLSSAKSTDSPITKDKVKTIDFYNQEEEENSLEKLITKIEEESKIPILYFYADWCAPCRAFRKSLVNPGVIKALKNAVLIKIDVDADLKGLAARYKVNAVPTYVKVNATGEVIAKIDSGEWGADIPRNIAPVMDRFVNKGAYDRK